MNLLAFHAANIGIPFDNRQRISPDSGITVSRLELNLRRPHRSMAAEVIGFRIRVWEGFLASWVTPAAGAEHDRLAGLLSASTAPASPVLGWVLAALQGGASPRGRTRSRVRGAPCVGVPTLVVTAERRYPQR